MNDATPPIEETSSSRIISLSLLIGVAGITCLLFLTAFLFFRPNQLSLSDQYFPSPTATLPPTSTPTPTPNLVATEQVIRSTATAQAIQALATESISQWPVLYSETFDSNSRGWVSGKQDSDFASSTREIKGGKYLWDVTAKMGFIEWAPANTRSVENFRLSADLEKTSGTSQSDYGLLFRKDAGDNFYYFGIDGSNFFVMLNYRHEWSTLIDYTRSTAILKDGVNRLTMLANGTHFIFFINDQFAGEITDDRIKKGITAIAVEIYLADLKATFEFDNYELRAP